MLIKILLVILAVMIVGSIMLQQGKGSDLGSAFGGGSSDSLFGPLGPSNLFFAYCLHIYQNKNLH